MAPPGGEGGEGDDEFRLVSTLANHAQDAAADESSSIREPPAGDDLDDPGRRDRRRVSEKTLERQAFLVEAEEAGKPPIAAHYEIGPGEELPSVAARALELRSRHPVLRPAEGDSRNDEDRDEKREQRDRDENAIQWRNFLRLRM